MIIETARGIAGSGRAQLDWLTYLLLQSVVVFVWWPKSDLRDTLASGDGPRTLLATMIAAGAATAWYSARAGAHEVLLPGQSGLRDRVVSTACPLARILGGYLAAHVLHLLHLLALAAPLMMMAFTVSGGDWDALGWCLTAILFQATFYQLAATALYLAIGHHAAMTTLSVRALVVATYILTTLFAPAASHLVLSSQLLGTAPPVAPAPSGPVVFLLAYGVLAAIALAVLRIQLARVRRAAVGR